MKVLMLFVVLSFGVMAYTILYDEIEPDDFDNISNVEKVRLHPLYFKLQKAMITDEGTLKKLYTAQHPVKKLFSGNGTQSAAIVTDIEMMHVSNVTQKDFYRHVKKSEPLVVHEGCLNWVAMKKWVNNPKQLSDKLKSTYVQKMARKEKYTLSTGHDLNQFYNLVRARNEDDILDFTQRKLPSFMNLQINKSQNLTADIVQPKFIGNVLNPKGTYLSNHDKAFKEPTAVQFTTETFSCVINGMVEYMIVSPVFS